MPLTERQVRLLSLSAAPALLASSTLLGVVLVTGSHDSAPHTRPTSAEIVSAARPSATPTTVALRVEEPSVSITGRPGWAAHQRALRQSAARNKSLARWVDSGHAAHRRASATATAAPTPTATPDDQLLAQSADGGSALAADTIPTPSASTKTASFGLSSFNVLGASHTQHGERGFAGGVARMRGVATLLARHDIDVAGFQELQQSQARELLRVTGDSYALYPGPGPGKDSENSVGWRTSEFELVQGTTIPIPYFDGHHRNMPVVLLRHKASGVEAWFGNFHNPAETARYHHQQKWRNLATAAEVAMANRIKATGVPLFVTGDMNERAAYFCRLTAGTDLKAARPGSWRSGGQCHAGGPRAVDWVFGSPAATFSGYDEDRSHLVDVTTDHPVISTRVQVAGKTG